MQLSWPTHRRRSPGPQPIPYVCVNQQVFSILATTYQLLTAVTDYTNFSCTWPGGQTNTANNIENIHNGIHSFIGGFGHMAFPEMAGFDPIFWMHHAQVDRLLAMWQVLNQNSYIVPTVNAFGSYYESVGTVDSGNTGKIEWDWI